MTNEELIEYIKILDSELIEEKEKRRTEAEEYSALEKEYEQMIEDLNKELLNAKGKIISQDITLASYKDKVGIPIIVEGKERDLYKGELKDFVLSVIESQIHNYDKYTRSYKICEDILESNHKAKEKEKILEVVQSALKGYNGMTKDVITKLNSVGISVIDDSKGHYKLLFGNDDRYIVSISHSPSDPRCGLNAISDINKMMF